MRAIQVFFPAIRAPLKSTPKTALNRKTVPPCS